MEQLTQNTFISLNAKYKNYKGATRKHRRKSL